MAKRFTDTEKWSDPWFRKLASPYQKLWLYILDSSDQAGVWKVDIELASFMTNETLDEETALKHFNGRVHPFGKDKWFIPKFIEFQYGVLDESCRPHKYVLKLLDYYGLLEVLKGICTFKDKNKDKDKDKVKDKDKDSHESPKDEKRSFDEDGLVLLTQEDHKRLIVKLGERKTADYIKKLSHYIGSKGKQYKSHYHTILSWANNEPEAVKKNEKKKEQRCHVCSVPGQKDVMIPDAEFTQHLADHKRELVNK